MFKWHNVTEAPESAKIVENTNFFDDRDFDTYILLFPDLGGNCFELLWGSLLCTILELGSFQLLEESH